MPSTNLHVNARPFAHLLGTWRGAGKGFYPTINDFEYNETLRISAVPNKPFFRYEQRTTSPDGAPMHQELGYIRFLGGDEVEFVLAQPTGQAEALFGFISDATPSNCTLAFQDSTVVNTPTAKQVDRTGRFLRVEGDSLHTEFYMAAVGQPVGQHLQSELTRDRG